jgi:dTDP-4-dehydrorhamnose 3,5-epimerase
LIQGSSLKPLKTIADERGYLMEILRCDDPFFRKFGQAYLTVVYPGVVKGWHWHEIQTDHFCVVKGMAKVVLYDRREGSPTHGQVDEHFLGERNLALLVIPHGVLHGMKGIGTEPALLLNIPSEAYNHEHPDEYRVDPHGEHIPYDWARRDG